MTDRFYAECMFGGAHRDHNPKGAYWAVTDRERSHGDDPSVIDYVGEKWARSTALRLSMEDESARPIRHAEASRRMKARMAAKAKRDEEMAARVEALGDNW